MGIPGLLRILTLIVGSENLQDLTATLVFAGYQSLTKPWSLGNTGLIFHRFLKPSSEDEFILDILEGTDDIFKAIIDQSLIAKGETGEIRMAHKKDLIYLKRLRNSLQDQVDIRNYPMKTPEEVLKKLSDLYEFNRRIKNYRIKEESSSKKPDTSQSVKPKSSD